MTEQRFPDATGPVEVKVPDEKWTAPTLIDRSAGRFGATPKPCPPPIPKTAPAARGARISELVRARRQLDNAVHLLRSAEYLNFGASDNFGLDAAALATDVATEALRRLKDLIAEAEKD